MRTSSKSHHSRSMIGSTRSCGLSKYNISILNNCYKDLSNLSSSSSSSSENDDTNYDNIIKEFKPYVIPNGVNGTNHNIVSTINKIALLSLTALERYNHIEIEYKSLNAYIKTLEEKQPSAINTNINTAVNVSVSFAMEYLLYIQKYGSPKDGVFDPILLAEFL